MRKLESALEKAVLMAEAKPVIVAPKQPRVIIPEIPVWVADKYAAIAIHGSALMSKRVVNIIGACFQVPEMDEGDHNCRSILLRDDGEPDRMMAIAASACKNMTLNLKRIFEVSTEEILKNPEYSILLGWHRNILLSVLHEINHLMLQHSPWDTEADADLAATRDNDADEWAWEKLVWMAKTMNIEPSNYLEEPFFSKAALGWIETLAEPLKSRQMHMLENKVMMMIGEDLETAKFVNSFKQVIHSMTDDAIEDPEWQKGPGTSMAEYVRDMAPTVCTSNVIGGFPGGMDTPVVPAETLTAQAGGFAVTPTQPPFAPAPAQTQFTAFTPATVAPPYGPTQFTPMNGGMAPAQPTQPAGAALPNHNLSPETIRDTVKAVIYKAYENIFRNCGWTTHSMTPFSNQEQVCKPIPLTDLEKQVVFAVDCTDEQGRACVAAPTTDGLRGCITSEKKLPMYFIYINANGTLLKRKLIPQNPATGSKIAQAAFDGSAIMIVMEGDRAVEEQLKQVGKFAHWYYKINNHEWTDLRSGR